MTSTSGKYDKLVTIVTIFLSIGSLVIAGISLCYSVQAFNIANNYPPSVDILGTTPLTFVEDCGPRYPVTTQMGNFSATSCNLSGTFNVTFSIISPHEGQYKISIGSFSPYTRPVMVQDLSFLGKNLTLVEVLFSGGTYTIKARNETSGHFANFVFIGSYPPQEWSVEEQLEIEGTPVGIVPAHGLQMTAVVTIDGVMQRLGNPIAPKETLGTLTGTLTYHDVPLNTDIQRQFLIEVSTTGE